MRYAVSLSVALVALALLAGCGSSSSSSSDATATFKQGYQPAVNGFQQTSRAVGLEIERAAHETDAQIQTAFQNLAGRWRTHLDQLRGLKPPSSVAAAYATLSGAATRVETDLNAAASAAATHSATAARKAGAAIVKDILAARAAATSINRKLRIK